MLGVTQRCGVFTKLPGSRKDYCQPLAAGTAAARHKSSRFCGVQIASAEAAHPRQADLGQRDEAGLYSREAPFWASLREASVMTAPDSNRRARLHCCLDLLPPGHVPSSGAPRLLSRGKPAGHILRIQLRGFVVVELM